MNSGLPSLLDAIFGKQDLALVSLDEMYEVIREFPSFNAGHFLLAKKLKLQDDPGYEKESMRTSLYFNNAFWLQSLLEDSNHFQRAESFSPVKEDTDEDQSVLEEEYPEETLDIIQEESNYTFESYTLIEQPVTEKDELDEETEEILEEKLNSDPVRSEETFQYAEPGSQTADPVRSEETFQYAEPGPQTADPVRSEETFQYTESGSQTADPVRSEETFQYAEPGPQTADPVRSEETFQYTEPGSQTVTSFDELMAKYNLQPLEMVDETAEAPEAAIHLKEQIQPEPEVAHEVELPAIKPNPERSPEKVSDQFETLEEVVNEYGVFEEKVIKKTDHDDDMDAFDEPLDQIPFVSDKIVEEETPHGQFTNTAEEARTEQKVTDEDTGNTPVVITTEDSGDIEHADITENQESPESHDQTDEDDYDAFDRPLEEPVQTEAAVNENENSDELHDYDPDNTGEPVGYSEDTETVANGDMQELSERFGEHHKMQSSFNANNAESIVFTPYHMVDYFASQGIKLILEDNPPDQFGKQLKSFTDWLKVMKRLAVQTSSEKEEEKINEQIRHFAAHSIEERDILTESMAEVLAKQGMYENAIALFQKLSLIYPPKSAYFASRIEQLKASLP